jgi:hypothetical protein
MKAKEFIPASKPRNFVAKNAQASGAGRHQDSNKKKDQEQGKVKHKKDLMPMEDTLSELSTDKLAQYKKAAGADAKKADSEGDYARGDKRFKGINKATNKQFDNDLKKHGQQGVAEVSKATLDRYVPKAVDAHGHADFSARQSKDDPTQRSYHKSQKHTAERRRQGISRALDRMSKTEGMAERVRDPEDWDEGNTEPANNFAVYINGKKWKVFKGRGRYADDNREQAHYQQLKDWAAKKSADTGKKWTVSITGEAATE